MNSEVVLYLAYNVLQVIKFHGFDLYTIVIERGREGEGREEDRRGIGREREGRRRERKREHTSSP